MRILRKLAYGCTRALKQAPTWVRRNAVDCGDSVVVIEHDLDVIAEADWILDLGPDGGKDGGRIVAAATPEEVVRLRTHTGQALGPVLARG